MAVRGYAVHGSVLSVPPRTVVSVIDPAPVAAAVMLDIAGKTWLYAGVKEHVIRECLGLSWTQFHQALNRLIDSPLGNELDPVTCRMLRSRRDRVKRSRPLSA